MKFSSILIIVLAFVGLLTLGVKLVSGAISLIGGLFNTILGLAVIAALIAIVVWMFLYARKRR